MRFIHTGDIHLGYTPDEGGEWAAARTDEIWASFERLIRGIKENPADMLIIAGDLFHRQPLLKEIKEVDYLFSTISGTKVVLMAGDHDAILPGSFYTDYSWSKNVIFLGGRNIERVRIPELNTDIYGLSYYTGEIRESLYDNILIEDSSAVNILVGHGGDAGHIPVNRRKLAMSGFDYAAFGHMHNPDLDERSRFAYCGAPEPVSDKDYGIRGYIAGNLSKETLSLEFVPFSKRECKHMTIDVLPSSTILEIRQKIKELARLHGSENIYTVTLKGRRNSSLIVRREDLDGACILSDVIDETVPDDDPELIYERNRDNLLGMFVDQYIHSDTPLDEVKEKALRYGIAALKASLSTEGR